MPRLLQSNTQANSDLSNYIPDFIVKTADGSVWIVETKGRAELDLPQKMKRLGQWCADATSASRAENGPAYGFVYVDQEGFERHAPRDFAGLAAASRVPCQNPPNLDLLCAIH
ncbi:MAG: hypothetical protein IPI21_17480 [Propionivibrio sp.]|nr:hypothetical protein [Propionivibrio sp.]